VSDPVDVIDLTHARRIGVISDTHGQVRPQLYPELEGVDAILHAGDLGSDDIEIELSPVAPFHAVAGNVDGFSASRYPRWLVFEIGRRRVGMTHVALGKGDLAPSVQRFVGEHRIDLLIFGHTHQPVHLTHASGLELLNPGSCGPRRFSLPVSIAFLDVDADGGVAVTLKKLL